MTSHGSHSPVAGPISPSGHSHGGHGLMMLACCIPMLAVAVVLAATGLVSWGFLAVAAVCVAMMALMMRGMGHGDRS